MERFEILTSDDHSGSMETEYDVICIGAGFAGLTAAHTLLKALPSLKICVLEAKGTVEFSLSAHTQIRLNLRCTL